MRALTLQWLSSLRWGGGQSSVRRVGSREFGGGGGGTTGPRGMRAKVWKVCTEEREADCSRQEVRQTSGGDVLRGAKKQKGGAKMEWGAELLNVHLRHVFICTLASANVSPPV